MNRFLSRLFTLIISAALILFCLAKGGIAEVSNEANEGTRETLSSTFWGSGFSNLSDVTDEFSRELFKEISTKKVYLDRTSMRDITTNDISNFSSYLQHELESSLSENNFRLVYDISDADYLIGANYRKHGEEIRIFFKYHQADGSGAKSRDYKIETSKLPGDSFEQTVKSRASRLAANILSDQRDLKIYIKPIKEGRYNYVSDFSNSFTSKVKTEIIGLSRGVEVIDEKPIYERLSNTRGIEKKAKMVKNLQNSEAFFADANAVLEGTYFVEGENVAVNLYLKNLDGRVLNSAAVDIKKSLIKANLENSEAKALTDLADISNEQGDKVKISTTKGGDYPIYFEGEKIKFLIQVAAPLYVYLYDINSKGEVSLLYPYERNGVQQKLMPGTLYTIPEERDVFELEVESPFGMDAVKIFASSMELPIPELTTHVATRSYSGNKRALVKKRKEIQEELSDMKSINPRDLVDYYRGIVQRFGTTLHEGAVMVETRAR